MKYYAYIINNEINGTGECFTTAEGLICYEITEEVYNDIDRYIWDGSDVVLNPNYPEIVLQQAKEAKYNEALTGAKDFINNEASYQFDENNSIEATDGNIGKMTAYALGFQTSTISKVYWTSKEDNVLELTAEDVLRILTGLGEIQGNIWNIRFVAYKNAIEQAQTVEEVNNIIIDYSEEQ